MANFCENCGSPLKIDNKFCPNCGAPVKQTEPEVPITPVTPN
jgi:predicted amidophosphoribosyltransferase